MRPMDDRRIAVPPEIIEGIVDSTYPDRFMVSVRSVHTRRFFESVQVASPYIHAEGGAGLDARIKRGTRVLLAIPSDGSPPCVLACIAHYRPPQGEEPGSEATLTAEQEEALALAAPNEPRFDSNREASTDGDMRLRGAEGQAFEILEGGMARAVGGATCFTSWDAGTGTLQSAFRHHHTSWLGGHARQRKRFVSGVATYEDTRVWRHKESEAHASLRVRVGSSLLGEPDAPEAKLSPMAAAEGLSLEDAVVEVAQAAEGFSTRDGEPVSSTTRNDSTFRLLLLRGGSLVFWLAMSLVIRLGKRLRIFSKEGITIETDGILTLKGKQGLVFQSEGVLKMATPAIHAGAASRGAVGQGDAIMFSLPPGTNLSGLLNGVPFTSVLTLPGGLAAGTIVSTGSPTLRMP